MHYISRCSADLIYLSIVKPEAGVSDRLLATFQKLHFLRYFYSALTRSFKSPEHSIEIHARLTTQTSPDRCR